LKQIARLLRTKAYEVVGEKDLRLPFAFQSLSQMQFVEHSHGFGP
jgi:hypothetical protein